MTHDEWKLPLKDFKFSNGYICINKKENLSREFFDVDNLPPLVCTGFRLECDSLKVPSWKENEFEDESPEVMIDTIFEYTSIEDLVGQTIELGEPMQNCDRELGSMYLLESHHLVKWQEIRFGKAHEGVIELEVDIWVDFLYDYTEFCHTLKGYASIEHR